MTNRKKNGLVNNIVYSSAGSIVYTFCQWLLTVIIIRICGYVDSGYYALAITITNVFYSISLWGVRSFQIADVDDKYNYSDYFYNRILTSLISILLFSTFILINSYTTEKAIIIIFYMIYKIVDSFYDFYDAICQKNMRMDIVSISMITRSILSIVVFTVICFKFKSVLFAIISMIIVSIMFLYFYNYHFCKKNLQLNYELDKKKVFQLLIVCLPLMLSGFIISFNLMIPKYIFEKMSGSELLGIYTTVTSPALIVQLTAQTVLAPLLPMLANYFSKKAYRDFNNIIKKFLLLSFIILIIAFVGIGLFGNWAIGFIYGANLCKYTYLLYLSALSSFFTIVSWLISYILLLVNRIKIQLLASSISAVVCFVVAYPCIKLLGLNGISTSIIISQICLLSIMILIIFNSLKTIHSLNK